MDPNYRKSQADRWDRWAPVYASSHPAGDPTQMVDFLSPLVGEGKALELGVGTGRVALELARRKHEVYGIDISPKMVEELNRIRGELPVEVTVGNMADVDAPGEFNLIYCVNSSFYGLLEQSEQTRCFQNAATKLSADGVFVLECFMPATGGFLDRKLRMAVRDQSDEHLSISTTVVDMATQTIHWQEVELREDRTTFRPVHTRFVWPSELDLMAQISGLKLLERYNNWRRDQFTGTEKHNISVYGRA
ncbi:class I SAM-dependent methyltransferase [Streptomyces achromogenes]